MSITDIETFKDVTELATLDKKQLDKIISRLPEYRRGSSIVGHSTSQSSYSLQTLQMISDSPLSRMKQCLAQINKKYLAVQEAYYNIEHKKIEREKLSKNTDAESRLTVQQITTNIEQTTVHMNTSLREIGMFQDIYDSIKKNNNISDDWNEKDFEKQEIENMLRASFRLAIQDLSATGRVSRSAVEYWEQLGVHPQVGEQRTRSYLLIIQEKINSSIKVTIRDMYIFLDSMVEEFKDSYQDALSRMGLDEIGSETFMAKGATKPR